MMDPDYCGGCGQHVTRGGRCGCPDPARPSHLQTAQQFVAAAENALDKGDPVASIALAVAANQYIQLAKLFDESGSG